MKGWLEIQRTSACVRHVGGLIYIDNPRTVSKSHVSFQVEGLRGRSIDADRQPKTRAILLKQTRQDYSKPPLYRNLLM